jgi:hypothetical protein
MSPTAASSAEAQRRRTARRLARTALFSVVRGMAATLGSAAGAGILWWFHSR